MAPVIANNISSIIQLVRVIPITAAAAPVLAVPTMVARLHALSDLRTEQIHAACNHIKYGK